MSIEKVMWFVTIQITHTHNTPILCAKIFIFEKHCKNWPKFDSCLEQFCMIFSKICVATIPFLFHSLCAYASCRFLGFNGGWQQIKKSHQNLILKRTYWQNHIFDNCPNEAWSPHPPPICTPLWTWVIWKLWALLFNVYLYMKIWHFITKSV